MSDNKPNSSILDSDTFDACRPILGQIAHDFNNLLTPLLAYPSLIRSGLPDGSSAYDLLDAIDKASRDMIHINEQLMLLSSRGSAEKAEVSIHDILETVVVRFASEHDMSNVSIQRDIPDGLPTIDLNVEQFSSALGGVLLNACESGAKDVKISLTVRACQISPEKRAELGAPFAGNYVQITVSDNGEGFSEEMLIKAAVPFVTTKKENRQRGSGLGLSVALVVCRDHGGFLHIANAPGGGAAVSLFIPSKAKSPADAQYAAGTGTEEAIADKEQDDGYEPRCKNRILLVDDEKTILKLFHMIISSALPDCEVDTAGNGQEALDLFTKKHHGVLVMDLHMPVMDGQTAFQEISSLAKKRQWEPPAVVFCTGFAPPDIVSHVVADSSCHCLLSKPVRGEVLVEAIKNRIS